MAESGSCLGHIERVTRRNKIIKALENPQRIPDENKRSLIKKGPVSEETSLKELEQNYVSKPEWKAVVLQKYVFWGW